MPMRKFARPGQGMLAVPTMVFRGGILRESLERKSNAKPNPEKMPGIIATLITATCAELQISPTFSNRRFRKRWQL